MQSIYLDNGATSFPKAPGVGEAMARYINEIGANVNRGTYKQASEAAMTVLDTRTALATLFSFGGGEDHVLFTPGATAGLNLLLQGYLHEGDHVIVSSLEHNAVMRPLVALAKRGVSFSRIPADENGLTDARDILPLFQPNTRLVLLSHASNVCGALFPLEETAAICAERGVPLAVDAAQTAGHYPIDFDALHLAALCVPGHKGLLGPQGVGALLLEKRFAKALAPIVTGGTGSASDSELQPDYMPDRFESGTQNLPGIFGLQSALAFVAARGVEALRAHEMALTKRMLGGLQALPLRVVGPTALESRVGVISIDMPMDNATAAYRLESEYGVMTRCGLHCAPNAHKTLHTFPQGTVRLSLGYATSEADVSAAIEALGAICATAGQGRI
ncbi:MAG: aminotransferase class V-fold PLP-dependent enzyme [Clostridia bacterium]|nr:aminotransferase class V-fold PLP-dependent enzyme [Clostridia bacterium]